MPRRRRKVELREEERLEGRVEDLELRVRLLEARVRQLAARVPEPKTPVKVERPRPRCPGCLLELPKGKRGDACVWCGFLFEATQKRAFRR